MKKTGNNLNLKKVLYVILTIIVVILLFTLIDYFVHSLSEKYSVPDYYFKNKIIYGSIWAFIVYFVLRKWRINMALKSLVFSGLIALILQARYYFEGYPLSFVLEFLVYHFIILWIVSYFAFRFMKNKI